MNPLKLLLLFAVAIAENPSWGKETPVAEPLRPKFGKVVRSPEIDAEGRITIRFHAPNAATVTLLREGA